MCFTHLHCIPSYVCLCVTKCQAFMNQMPKFSYKYNSKEHEMNHTCMYMCSIQLNQTKYHHENSPVVLKFNQIKSNEYTQMNMKWTDQRSDMNVGITAETWNKTKQNETNNKAAIKWNSFRDLFIHHTCIMYNHIITHAVHSWFNRKNQFFIFICSFVYVV